MGRSGFTKDATSSKVEARLLGEHSPRASSERPGGLEAPSAKRPLVLLVEDERLVGRAMSRALDRAGADIEWVKTIADARQRLRDALAPSPDVVALDLCLLDGSGEDLIDDVQRQWPEAALLTMSAYASPERVAALFLRHVEFVPKPLPGDTLVRVIAEARARHQAAWDRRRRLFDQRFRDVGWDEKRAEAVWLVMGQELTYKEAADLLSLTERNVEEHLVNAANDVPGARGSVAMLRQIVERLFAG